MRYFPAFLDVRDRKIVVFGGGEDAARKVRLIGKTDGHIDVVSGSFCAELRSLAAEGRVNLIESAAMPDHLKGAFCVFCASDDKTNTAAAATARELGIPVNVVDRPDLSTFITPAIVDRDPLLVAIGSEGAGPMLASGLRAQIEALLPAQLGDLLVRARALRPEVARSVPTGAPRRAFWQRFFFGDIRDRFLAGSMDAFRKTVADAMAGRPANPQSGHVCVVCVPDGDLELLTLKAHRRLQEADVIVHEGSHHLGVLEFARRDAMRYEADGSLRAIEDGQRDPVSLIASAVGRGERVVYLVSQDRYDMWPCCDGLLPEFIETEFVPCGVRAGAIDSESQNNWAGLADAGEEEVLAWRAAS